MSNELLASKIVINEEEPRIRSVPSLPTAVLAMLGVTERGPLAATQVTSFEEYIQVYGGFTTNADVTLAAQGFFENGGQFLWVKRIVHLTDITDEATAISAAATLNLLTASGAATAGTVLGTNVAPFDLDPGDTIIVDTDAVGDQTATVTATAATVTGANTETFVISDGQTLTFEVDNGVVQTVTFNTGEFANIALATAAEVAAVINAEAVGIAATEAGGAVIITSDLLGTDSDLDTFGGTANAALGFTALSDTGTGNVANVNAVTVAEIKTMGEAAWTNGSGVTVTDVGGQVRITSNTTGASSSVAVDATSTGDDELGLDNATHSGTTGVPAATFTVDAKTDGVYGNGITILVAAATSGSASEFNLQVLVGGAVQEIYPNLSMDATALNYIETIINDVATGSDLVAITDLLVAAPPLNVPDVGTFGPLTGGDDGLAGLADTDYTGSSAGGTGLYGLDQVQGVTLLAIPGQATSAIHNAMINYAETTRDKSIFTILDPPAATTAAGMVTYTETTATLLNSSEFGAIYWPQVKVLNPSASVFGNAELITVPPSGIVAGVYARTDSSVDGGIYQPPAGIERGRLLGVLGFETDEVLDEAKRDLVYPKRINPLTSAPGVSPYIDGTRTLKGDGNFPTVAERRGVIFIEQSIKTLLGFARHSNNNKSLRSAVTRTVETFLIRQMNVQAFRTTDPDTAFFVDFGDGLNPDSVVFAGKMVGRIGLATNKPADFIVLKFAQDTRALEQELASS